MTRLEQRCRLQLAAVVRGVDDGAGWTDASVHGPTQLCGQGDGIVKWEGRAAYLPTRFQLLFKTTTKAKGEERPYPELFGRTNLGTALAARIHHAPPHRQRCLLPLGLTGRRRVVLRMAGAVQGAALLQRQVRRRDPSFGRARGLCAAARWAGGVCARLFPARAFFIPRMR